MIECTMKLVDVECFCILIGSPRMAADDVEAVE